MKLAWWISIFVITSHVQGFFIPPRIVASLSEENTVADKVVALDLEAKVLEMVLKKMADTADLNRMTLKRRQYDRLVRMQ